MSAFRCFFMIVIVLMFCIVSPITGQSQMHKGTQNTDEVLALISAEKKALADTPVQVRVYQRFPRHFLIGTDRAAIGELRNAGVRPIVVDEQPWSASYAVVSSLPEKKGAANYARFQIRLLATVDDLDIVTGTPAAFALLRDHGFSCVEIERNEIPVSLAATYLSTPAAGVFNDEIARIISAVSESTITSCIWGMQNFGTRYAMNANRDSVFRWVRQRFLDAGVADVRFDSFQYSGTWQKNVIATIPGTVNPSAEIIVGGHLDSYSSNLQQAPGADDNASGTTAAIEMARVLIQENYQPTVTLRFIGFAAEEVGLRGSADYAFKARQQNRDIKVMMNYDMIGYRNQAQPDRDFYIVWYPGSEAFSNLHGTMATSYTTLTPVYTTSYRSSSDSWSFYQQNYNTLFCIERDFNPYYHTPNDLLVYLDIPYTRDIIRAGLAMLLTLDALPPSVVDLTLRDRGNGTSLVVGWDSVAVPDWYRYKVSVGTQPGIYTSSYLQTSRSRTITGLTTGTRYYIGVSILDLAGNESMIVERSEIPLLIPRSPQGTAAESIENGVRITWQPNSELDILGYDILRATGSDTTFVLLNGQPFRSTVWIDSPLVAGTYSYYVRAVDSSNYVSAPSDTVTASPIMGIAQNSEALPRDVTLSTNYPNPFNPTTTLSFEIPQTSHVSLRIFDLLGQEVAALVGETLPAGKHSLRWKARHHASGVYVAVLQVGHNIRKQAMILLK